LADVVTAPLPKVPREVVMTAHWLAIEGVQPAVPQNPIAAESDSSAMMPLAGAAATVAANNDGSGGPANNGNSGNGVDARPLVKHVLSEELQAYFSNVVSAVHAFADPPGADESARQTWRRVVDALRRDGGVQQLVPYFTQFIADEVQESLRQLPILRAVLELCEALLHNAIVSVEPYLHQLMPPLLTCLVGKHLSATPAEDHWALRDFAATLVALICDRFGRNYGTLQPRVTKTLLHALLDPTKSLATHYGAIRGLTELGPMVIGVLLMPNVVAYVDALRPHRDVNSPNRADADRCFEALATAATRHVAHRSRTGGDSVGADALHQALAASAFGNNYSNGGGGGGGEHTSGAASTTTGKRRQSSGSEVKKEAMAVDDEPSGNGVSNGGAAPSLYVPYEVLYEIFGEALNVARADLSQQLVI
jgi:transcription initiation factor TFIID subunit 6